MTSPRGRGPAPDDSGQVMRGAVLIAIAVVLGFVLLTYGFPSESDTESSATDGSIPADDSPTVDTSTDGAPTATTAPPATAGEARPPAEVTVLVANGSGVPGAASDFTGTLNADGYVTAEPANADRKDYSTTVVYYVGEEQAEAAAVATALGLDPNSVQPMPDPVPTEDGDLRNSTVLVIIGTDQAG